MKTLLRILLGGLIASLPLTAAAQEKGPFSLRLGVGTDITLGTAYGIGGRFTTMGSGRTATEFGADFYVARSEETTEEFHTYKEKTDLNVFAARINWLFNYSPKSRDWYYLFGTGAGAFSVEWEESSETDTSLGTPCCGGGSLQREEGTVFGAIVNFGFGRFLTDSVDFRVELPIFLIPSSVGEAANVVPTLTATIGMRF